MNLFEKFGIDTTNKQVYEIAFMHTSYSSKHDFKHNYERLEFLGDSILSLLVSEYLFKRYPDYEEGKLTKLRSNYVCQNALIYYSHELDLPKYLKLDTEDPYLTENEVLSITADIFESFLGAMFIDQGIDFAKEFLAKYIFQYIDEEKVFFRDYKSAMKEYGDAQEVEVSYIMLNEFGFPHDKTFFMSILVDGEVMGVGKGRSKKEAEQAAAKVALEKLEVSVF